MTEWKRYGIRRTCGHCSRPIYPGQPARVFSGVSGSERTWRLIRCVECSAADGVTPPRDLPELPAPPPPPVVRRDVLTPVGAIARSGRDRQVGEDDE